MFFERITGDMLPKPTILVVGDLILDVYRFGEVNRISPEAPIPILTFREQNAVLGGAANVAMNIASLNCNVKVVGVLGNDEGGEKISRLMKKHSRIQPCTVSLSSRPTTTKTRYVCGAQQLLRVDHETVSSLCQAEENLLIEKIEESIGGCCIIVISDYLKGVLTDKILDYISSVARKMQIKVLVDPKREDFYAYKRPFLVKPNLKELESACSIKISRIEDVVQACERLVGKVADNILVTLSEQGMLLVEESDYHLISAKARQVYDVSGAGDTVIATVAVALSRGESLISAINIANVAAGIVVGKAGTASIQFEELQRWAAE